MSKAAVLKIASVILALASLMHFMNFIMGGVLVIMGVSVPVSFSLFASFLTGFISFQLRKC